MDTVRFQKLHEPSQTKRLLERLVTQAGLVPAHAYQLRDCAGLSPALRGVITEATANERVWNCWTDGSCTWLFTAKFSMATSRERGAPVLMVNEYGEPGDLKATGHWMVDLEGHWQCCTD